MKNLFYALSAFVLIGLSSCGGVDCDDTAAMEALLNETLEASAAYDTDPSSENCKAFKSVLEESLDYSDCEGNTQEDIDVVMAIIDSLDC